MLCHPRNSKTARLILNKVLEVLDLPSPLVNVLYERIKS
jgi:hypothetical protein